MNPIVIYKSKYGSTKAYAEWVSEELNCRAFDVKSVNITAKAAAKYVNKKLAVNFDYLMFHGDNSPFNLGGHYNIGGSIFGNGNVNADGGSGSSVSGIVFSAQNASCNQYSVTVGGLQSNATNQ